MSAALSQAKKALECPSFDFKKYVGAGNDFIIIDNLKGALTFSSELIAKLCNRHYGVGADGIILLQHSNTAGFKMLYFNSDGGQAEMCGNGLRCLVRFIASHIKQQNSYSIEVNQEVYQTSIKDDLILVKWPEPKEVNWNVELNIGSKQFSGAYLNTGVPHFVCLLQHPFEGINIDEVGRAIRRHPFFKPAGANVNFIYFDSAKQELLVRTYERGVEAETLACGTGVVASALTFAHYNKSAALLKVRCHSGEKMEVSFIAEDGKFHSITLAGPAKEVFQARWET
ncbi:MAG: diaminopimelate epimerase [Chlamydiales bacterium]|nr:diaminopimelate epimerase [Chlamydiales bacterium]